MRLSRLIRGLGRLASFQADLQALASGNPVTIGRRLYNRSVFRLARRLTRPFYWRGKK